MEQGLLPRRVSTRRFDQQQDVLFEEGFKEAKEKCYNNCVNLWTIIIIILVCIHYSEGQTWGNGIRLLVWLGLGIKLVFFKLELVYLLLVKFKLVLAGNVDLTRTIFRLLLTPWHIYVVIKFFSSENTCKNEVLPLWYAHLALLIESLWYLLLIGLILCCLSVFLVCVCIRKQENRQEEAQRFRIKDALIHAANLRFDPANLSPEDSCCIWLEEYKQNDEIICLPCNERHFFHAACIGDWVKHSNNCPLWKEPITEEDIRECELSSNHRREDLEMANRS